MRNPFHYYYAGGNEFVVEDRRSKETVALGVPHAYIHRLVDALNADAEARRIPTARELLQAFE